MTTTDPLPRSPIGGFMRCLRCTTDLWVPRNGVRLCGDCRAALEAQIAADQQTKTNGEQQ